MAIVFLCYRRRRNERRKLLQLLREPTIVSIITPLPSVQQYQTTTTVQYPYNNQQSSSYGAVNTAFNDSSNTNLPPSYNSVIKK